MTTIEIRQALLEDVQRQVEFADTKATLLVAADALLVSALLTALKDFGPLIARPTYVLLIISLLSAIAAVLIGLLTIAPSPIHWREECSQSKDLLRFSRIANCFDRVEDCIAEFNQYEESQIADALLVGVYGRSKWALRKYRLLRYAVSATMGSGVAASLAVLMEVAVKLAPHR